MVNVLVLDLLSNVEARAHSLSAVSFRDHRGGPLTLTWYTFMYLSFGMLFREIWYSDRPGFSSETKEPKFKNWVYFEQIQYCKKHPISAKLGAFLSV